MESDVDELLPLSRRLDWRFLLPDPTLNRVAYVGPESSSLLPALQRFSRELVTGDIQPSDLVVLTDPTLSDFKNHINSASAFYVELHRPSWQMRLRQVAAPSTFLRAAAKAGFNADAYWHYPDFEAATRIIPLSIASPLLHVIAKNRHDIKTRIKTTAMGWFLKSGLLARTVLCLSVIGFKA
jgi:hypothetical protein